MQKLFEITFSGVDEMIRLAETQAELLTKNAETAVANTVLLGVARIASDCEVDTGRLHASIAGQLADEAGVDLRGGDPQAIAEGQRQSVTGINGLEGRIGTNVEYALYVEYGHKTTGPKKLTRKQLAYLFARGILRADSKGNVIPGTVSTLKWEKGKLAKDKTQIGIHLKINRRAGIANRVKGKGFFRKNLPILQRHFNEQMERAIAATREGRLLRKGE